MTSKYVDTDRLEMLDADCPVNRPGEGKAAAAADSFWATFVKAGDLADLARVRVSPPVSSAGAESADGSARAPKQKLKDMSRGAGPRADLRGRVWATLAAQRRAAHSHAAPISYSAALTTIARETQPVDFGGNFLLARLALNSEGQEKAKQVLQCVAVTHPEHRYCPWLPGIVCVLLHWLAEEEAFAVASSLLLPPPKLVDSRLASWNFVAVFEVLAQQFLPKAFASLAEASQFVCKCLVQLMIDCNLSCEGACGHLRWTRITRSSGPLRSGPSKTCRFGP